MENGKYTKLQALGKGSFGFVQLARSQATQELVAIKFLKRGEVNKYVGTWPQRSRGAELGVHIALVVWPSELGRALAPCPSFPEFERRFCRALPHSYQRGSQRGSIARPACSCAPPSPDCPPPSTATLLLRARRPAPDRGGDREPQPSAPPARHPVQGGVPHERAHLHRDGVCDRRQPVLVRPKAGNTYGKHVVKQLFVYIHTNKRCCAPSARA